MNVPHYSEGATGLMFKVILTAGSLPYKYLRYFDANLETLRKRIRAYVKDGVMTETTYFGTKEKAILLAPIKRVPEEILNSFGENVVRNYEENCLQDRERAIHRDGDRAEKNAEAVMMMMAAEVPTAYNEKPPAAGAASLTGIEAFYSAREVKQMNPDDYADSMTSKVLENEIKVGRKTNKKTMGARAHGLYISDEGFGYVMYVVGSGTIQWSTRGERAHLAYVNNRLHGRGRGVKEVSSAIFAYSKDNGLLKIFDTSKRNGYLHANDDVYEKMYFLPRERTGAAMLMMMRNGGWEEDILGITVSEEERIRTDKAGQMCDGQAEDGTYILSFCVPDLKRLRKFYDNALIAKKWILNDNATVKPKYKVICYDFQESFVKKTFEKVACFCKIETVPFWIVYNKFYAED